jgi:2-iminoacetate synthase
LAFCHVRLGRQIYSEIAAILREKDLDGSAERWRQRLEEVTDSDVQSALSEPAGSYSLRRLTRLVSPAAENYLEQMAKAAHTLTVQRFGRTIRLYAPLYLSNYCSNSCRYCGFNKDNESERIRLTVDEALEEARIIAAEGFRDILLVSSEDREFVSVGYLAQLAKKLRTTFGSISIEVYQMSSGEYARLFEAGIEGVTLYQETYDRQAYEYYHPAGAKSDYDGRLTTPDAIAAAGMREVGLGALLGLADWRLETLALAEHAHYLMKRYWKSHVSFSFPRLRPITSSCVLRRASCVTDDTDDAIRNTQHAIRDKNLVQMITALRLCFADAGLVLSTRENARLRDNLMKVGITKMSAGSKTNPGGYSGRSDAVEQFKIDDSRRAIEVAAVIASQGFEPVWKDWDRAFLGN